MGLAVAFIRIALELMADKLDEGTFLHAVANTNFLTFAAWFFLFCIIWCVVISLLTPAPAPESVNGLTFSTLTEEQKAATRNSYNVWDIVFSVIVIGIVIFVMISFRG